jgi:hypothetical protein
MQHIFFPLHKKVLHLSANYEKGKVKLFFPRLFKKLPGLFKKLEMLGQTSSGYSESLRAYEPLPLSLRSGSF